MIPGEYILRPEPVTVNAGREAIDVVVVNTGDRPVQVGSHYHFAEANAALEFDRRGCLRLPAGHPRRAPLRASSPATARPSG